MEKEITNEKIIGKDLIRYFILIFWSLFWLLNVIDKLIGGAHFLFVGRDRFAQIQRFFDSIGLSSPSVANITLVIITALETFALIFFLGAMYHFVRKNLEATRSWFFVGIALTLSTYIFFTIGDQIFGDHFELLEHALFWFIALLSWIIFILLDKIQVIDSLSIGKNQFLVSIVLIVIIGSITTFAIFWHNHTSFEERTQAVEAEKISKNKYKIEFPFLAGSTAFEKSIAKFKEDNPKLSINYIYTAPQPLRLGQSDGLIIYILTDNK